MQNCSRCHYWRKLVDTPESYGECTFTIPMALISDPMRLRLSGFSKCGFGSVPPSAGKECKAFLSR